MLNHRPLSLNQKIEERLKYIHIAGNFPHRTAIFLQASEATPIQQAYSSLSRDTERLPNRNQLSV